MSKLIHVQISIPKQYQMMTSSVARVIFFKTKVIFRYNTEGVSNQVLSNSDHETKSYSCWNSHTKVGKSEKVKKNSRLQNGTIRGVQIGAGFRDCKSGEEGLKTGAALGITNRDRDFKSEQRDLKSGQRLQIGAREITNRCKTATNRSHTFLCLNCWLWISKWWLGLHWPD